MVSVRDVQCSVSHKCNSEVFVLLKAPEVHGCEMTYACRRHAAMALDMLLGFTDTIGIEAV